MKMKKLSNTATVANMLRTKPGLKADDIVKKLKVSKVYAYNLLTQARKKMVDDLPVVEDTVTDIAPSVEPMFGVKKYKIVVPPGDDNINPAHYKVGGIETIDFIEAKLTAEEYRGYLRGNVLKYMSRADHKGDRLENLKKAQWYLNREIGKA